MKDAQNPDNYFLLIVGKFELHESFDEQEHPEYSEHPVLQLQPPSPLYILVKLLILKMTAPATIIATMIISMIFSFYNLFFY